MSLNYFIGTILIIMLISCSTDSKIEKLLSSNDMDDLISGALKAGKSKTRKFVNLILQDANDPRRSTRLGHKGLSVYQAKMMALQRIFDQEPPKEISPIPDSLIINFYTELAYKENRD